MDLITKYLEKKQVRFMFVGSFFGILLTAQRINFLSMKRLRNQMKQRWSSGAYIFKTDSQTRRNCSQACHF
jgi:hypothetical protein